MLMGRRNVQTMIYTSPLGWSRTMIKLDLIWLDGWSQRCGWKDLKILKPLLERLRIQSTWDLLRFSTRFDLMDEIRDVVEKILRSWSLSWRDFGSNPPGISWGSSQEIPSKPLDPHHKKFTSRREAPSQNDMDDGPNRDTEKPNSTPAEEMGLNGAYLVLGEAERRQR